MAKDESAKPKRGRRSKAEIQEEFDLMVEAENNSKAFTNTKEEELIRHQEKELINSVQDFSTDEIVRKFANLNIEISKTLGSLSDKLISEIDYLAKLRKVAELEKNEIERLHKIDVAQTALDSLIEEYQLQQQQLEGEITAQRSDWEYEQSQKEIELESEKENLDKTRKREIEDYEYKKNLERKKAHDKYEEDIRLRDKQNKEKQEVLEKNWQQREASIKSQEEELISLRKIVEESPVKLQKEIDKAVADAIQRTELKRSQEIELLKRDSESEKRIAELKIKTLEESLLRGLEQFSSMQNQVNEAKKQVQDIAVKAIEGASGSKTLQFAMEQAKRAHDIYIAMAASRKFSANFGGACPIRIRLTKRIIIPTRCGSGI